MEAKRVLILGAGLVARPMVRYLLEHGFSVTVASRTVARADALLEGHPLGKAVAFVVEDKEALDGLIRETDLLVSLLPANRHIEVARRCLALGRPLVTTSYVSPAMQSLDAEARERGLLLLNECGLDPGIDHMSAMQVIHKVKENGGKIRSFISWCGGLPAPEANDNPWYYKFSWSPRGVLVAAMSEAQWLEQGEVRRIEAGQLFRNFRLVEVPGAGTYEGYPNRDSASYVPIYGLEDSRTVLRGTLRNPGHCARWQHLVQLGLLAPAPEQSWSGRTYAQLIRSLVPGDGPLAEDLPSFLKSAPDSEDLSALRSLGLLDEQPIPVAQGAPVDVMAELLQRRLVFTPGQRDMILLKHEFVAEYPESGRQEEITATMVDFGIPHGDSAMARTVSLPAAIAVRRILQGEIGLTGVHRPTLPELYQPLLEELKTLDIEVKEQVRPLS